MPKLNHLLYLQRCVELAEFARNSGNCPFAAVLAGPDGTILLERENSEITDGKCTGHAETMLMEAASQMYPKEFLWECTLYTTAEPCAMCAGAIYWGNVGRVVFGITEKRLAQLTGQGPVQPAFDLPCSEVFARGKKPIKLIGPFPEVEEATVSVLNGFWKTSQGEYRQIRRISSVG
ncbi:nucleoside deaminase [Gorillibacterium massiliense]|uniref:nucleoside deaminase n=1 Tax=Gorillibacterium massiliense TaxID=1280390 RepID=UPI0004B7F8B1|nr:nucleoside deaminase [Gorillibacterium massiliense]